MVLRFLFIFFSMNPYSLNLASQSCQVCSFDTYDKNYQIYSKITLNLGLNFVNTDCIPKNQSFINNRKILVTNNDCSNYNVSSFDICYNDLMNAFHSENKLSLISLHSICSFYFSKGDHFVLRQNIEYSEEEIFRRTLIKISFQPLNLLDIVTIYIKSNEFYFFISDSMTIENINFVGNDLEFPNSNDLASCYNNQTLKCCKEIDYSHISDGINPCFLKTRKIPAFSNRKFYGLFNLERIFDNNPLISPKISITNCSFSNFFPINIPNRWFTLFSLAPYSTGILMVDNVSFSNVFFPQSMVYYSQITYDLLSVYCQNLSNIQSPVILMNNTIFENYNQYQIDNSYIQSFSIFQIFDFDGNFTIFNTNFNKLFTSISIFSFINDKVFGSFFLKNVVINIVQKHLLCNSISSKT